MPIKLQKILWSLALFVGLALICHLYSSTVTNGIISPEWTIYYLEWLALGGLGLAFLLLKWFKLINSPKHFLYTFVGVANICNAICGAYLLYRGHQMNEMANYLALMGATLCVGYLILVDIFG